MKLLAAVLLAAAVGGCAPAPPSPPPAVSGAPLLGLVTVPVGPDQACAGVGLTAMLRGDESDPHLAWIEQFPSGGGRREVVWPAGFSARFDPQLEIVDQNGRGVIQEGDFVEGSCGSPQPGTLLLMPPFLALRLDCGPLAVADCTGGRLFHVVTANGWPGHPIAQLDFLTADGIYRITFEDGSTTDGKS